MAVAWKQELYETVSKVAKVSCEIFEIVPGNLINIYWSDSDFTWKYFQTTLDYSTEESSQNAKQLF